MRFYGADETRVRLAFAPLVDALRAMFARGCELAPRQVLELAGGGAEPVTSLVMPAWQEGGCYGVKVVNIAPGNAARGLPGLHSTYVLYDAGTGVPLAWIDGDEITARRTAATSALAAAWLAPAGARHLAVIGAGRIARLLPEAHRVVRPIERVTVWARSPARADELVDELAAQGFDARVAPGVEAAVAEADIVSCATLARAPVVFGRWLAPGSHLDLIGSFMPAMREADDACFAAARVIIDSDDATIKSGDLIGPLARGVVDGDEIGTLAELARGQRDGGRAPGQRTVFKSVGSALEDLAAAMLVHGADVARQA
jgi:ornithine cyclodeaminase/alanine dehydrogenase-like protein (mu-crystallin family)